MHHHHHPVILHRHSSISSSVFRVSVIVLVMGLLLCPSRSFFVPHASSFVSHKVTNGKQFKFPGGGSSVASTCDGDFGCDDDNACTGNDDVIMNLSNEELCGCDEISSFAMSRRGAIGVSAAAMTALCSTFSMSVEPANAKLARFPVEKLENTYHLMRAGESLLEEEGILSTNPLFLTSSDSALSEKGKMQVEDAVNYLKEQNQTVTLIKYSLAANSMGSCTIVGDRLKLGGDRRLQEFTYMDPRALGKWDGMNKDEIEAAVWAMDDTEAGPFGTGGEPPPTEDSTPHETLATQVTRLRQLISVLDTSFSGDSILIIFPDGTGPAVLTCMIGGIPLNRVHELHFEPGEIRFNITQSRALSMLPAEPLPTYQEKIEKGKEQLSRLRENSDSVMSVNERRYEEERKSLQADEDAKAKAREEARLMALAQEKEKRLKAKEDRERLMKENKEKDEQRKAKVAIENKVSTSASSLDNSPTGDLSGSISVVGVVGAVLAGLALRPDESTNDEDDREENKNEGEMASSLVIDNNENRSGVNPDAAGYTNGNEQIEGNSSNNSTSNTIVTDSELPSEAILDSSDLYSDDERVQVIKKGDSLIGDATEKFIDSDERASVATDEIAKNRSKEIEQNKGVSTNIIGDAETRPSVDNSSTDEYDDDEGDAWLRMMQDMITEEDSDRENEKFSFQ